MCDLHRDEPAGETRSGITDLVDELTVAMTNARIYSESHPRCRSSIASLLRTFEAVAKAGGSDRIVLGFADRLLVYEGKALVRASLSSARMIEAMKACRAGAIAISRQAGEQDVIGLIQLLASNRKGYATIDEANADLAQRGCRSVHFLPEYSVGPADARAQSVVAPSGNAAWQTAPVDVSVAVYQQTVGLLQDTVVRVCHGSDVDLDGANGYVGAILERLSEDAASMMGLARYERYDAYTFGHSIRVCLLALHFARSLFDDEDLLLRIGLASLLHDIGKARVPFEVLHATGALSAEERAEMNKHTTHGAEILLGLPKADPLAIATAFGHHRTLSGGGYPRCLHPPRESMGTQIVKLCDVYEALTAVRPYKPRMRPIRAYRVMISMKDHFSPALLRRFIEVNGVYPPGCLVELSTGEVARVLRQSADPLLPLVHVEEGPTQGPRQLDPARVRDLSAPRGGTRPTVVAMIDDAA
jgi:putative nucleotidyltransferase with HDIG domain